MAICMNTATPMATSTSVTSTGTATGGSGTTTGSTMTGTTTTRLRCPQFSHFPAFPFERTGFCLVSWPLHPPRFLPISSSLSDIAMYFLLSIDLVSHMIMNNILMASIFFIAKRTYGCFSVGPRKLAAAIASIISTNNESMR